MSAKIKEFVSYVKRETKAAGATCYLSKGKNLRDGKILLSGYFQDEPPVLAVATNRPRYQWIEILAHEFSHLTQWVENIPLWKALERKGAKEILLGDLFWHWLDGEDFKPKIVARSLAAIRDMEFDCERRALKLLVRFDLLKDPTVYARRANAYIHFHNVALLHRRWHTPKERPYYNKGILAAMNPTLRGNCATTSPKLIRTLEQALGWSAECRINPS